MRIGVHPSASTPGSGCRSRRWPIADDQVTWVERLGELVLPAAAEL